MKEDKISLFNHFFSNQPETILQFPFRLEYCEFQGTISVTTPKGIVEFDVSIADTYPFSKSSHSGIQFICKNLRGYRHLNYDNSVCMHTEPNPNIDEKLAIDWTALQKWICQYYIEEKEDDHYEYYVVPYSDGTTLFFTDVARIFKAGEGGEFEYLEINTPIIHESRITRHHLFISRIDTSRCDWAEIYHMAGKRSKGLWLFIDKEPTTERRIIVENWFDLEEYLSEEFLKKLDTLKQQFKKKQHINPEETFILLVGYYIPSPNGKEVHWQAIKIPFRNIPVCGEKENGKWIGVCIDQKIDWIKTENISHHRFFGRGMFCEKITKSKILLIGLGAIGSSLATILARGGIRNLAMLDFDTIKAGNICRSSYTLGDVDFSKIVALSQDLIQISPFIDISSSLLTENFPPVINKNLDEPFFTETEQFLNQFDYIFDCSTDNELAYILDRFSLKGEIINISISNKAKEMACVVRGKNSTVGKQLTVIFESLEKSEGKFYEGTGCWDPTFEASFFDVNALLNITLKNLNYKIKNSLLDTFIVRNYFNNNRLTIDIIDY